MIIKYFIKIFVALLLVFTSFLSAPKEAYAQFPIQVQNRTVPAYTCSLNSVTASIRMQIPSADNDRYYNHIQGAWELQSRTSENPNPERIGFGYVGNLGNNTSCLAHNSFNCHPFNYRDYSSLAGTPIRNIGYRQEIWLVFVPGYAHCWNGLQDCAGANENEPVDWPAQEFHICTLPAESCGPDSVGCGGGNCDADQMCMNDGSCQYALGQCGAPSDPTCPQGTIPSDLLCGPQYGCDYGQACENTGTPRCVTYEVGCSGAPPPPLCISRGEACPQGTTPCCGNRTCTDGTCGSDSSIVDPPEVPVYSGPIIDIDSLIAMLYSFGTPVAIVVFGIPLILLNGYKIMTSEGDPAKIKEGKEGLTAAILGLLFVLMAFTLLRIALGGILGITPGF